MKKLLALTAVMAAAPAWAAIPPPTSTVIKPVSPKIVMEAATAPTQGENELFSKSKKHLKKFARLIEQEKKK